MLIVDVNAFLSTVCIILLLTICPLLLLQQTEKKNKRRFLSDIFARSLPFSEITAHSFPWTLLQCFCYIYNLSPLLSPFPCLQMRSCCLEDTNYELLGLIRTNELAEHTQECDVQNTEHSRCAAWVRTGVAGRMVRFEEMTNMSFCLETVSSSCLPAWPTITASPSHARTTMHMYKTERRTEVRMRLPL